MSIASQPGKFKSNLSKSRTICPNRGKTISFQDHCILATNLRFFGCHWQVYRQKQHQPLKFKFYHQNQLRRPPGTTDIAHVSKFSNHKNCDNSEVIGSSDSHQACTILQNFSPYPPQFKSYRQKGTFLIPFKTLVRIPFKTLDWIPFKTPNICKTQHCSYIYEISFQDPYSVPL